MHTKGLSNSQSSFFCPVTIESRTKVNTAEYQAQAFEEESALVAEKGCRRHLRNGDGLFHINQHNQFSLTQIQNSLTIEGDGQLTRL